MNKLRGRLAFDLILTALLVAEMFFQLTGDFLHEVLGVVFFATIVLHLVLSRKWISATSRSVAQGKKLKKGNALRAAFGIALGITTLVLMASSLAISNQLYVLFGISLAGAAYSTWVVLHTISSYLMCCLVTGHLIIHWASVAAAFRIPYNRERREAINTGMGVLAALGVAAIGLRGSDALASAVAAATQSTAGSDATSSSTSGAMQDVSDLSAPSSTSAPAANANTTSTAKGGKARNRSRQQGATESSTSGIESNNSTNEKPNSSFFEAPSSNSGSGTSSTGSSSTVIGYCPLCPKHCPLSAPQCDRPYAAGLI